MRGAILLTGLALLLGGGAVAHAQDDAPTSDTVEFVRHVPIDIESAIGAERVGQYLYLTGTRAVSIYDVADPLDPQLAGHFPLGYQWQNEDVSTNGKIMLISESLPGDILHVWDVSDPQLPHEVGRVLFAGNHTTECLYDCTWSYGSEGDVVDLRDPENPVLAGNWADVVGLASGAHDVNEIRPGLVAVATLEEDFMLLDVEDPLHPQVVARGPHPDPGGYILHQVDWPRAGADRLFLGSGEGGEGPFLTFRVGGTGASPTFEHVDSWTLGTTSHWFHEHPRFRDGGLVVVAWYGSGTRFLQVAPDGMISSVGHYNPGARPLIDGVPPPSTWAAKWITDDIVYAIDNSRGLDILRWIGPIPQPPAPPPAPAAPGAPGAPGAAPPACSGAAPAAHVQGRAVRFPGARSIGIWRRGRLISRVLGDRVRAARVPRGVVEARARVGDGVRRAAIVRTGRRLRVGAALETSGACGVLESASLSGPAYGRRAPLRLRYTLTAAAAIEIAANGRRLRAPGNAGSHVLTIPARGRRVSVRVKVPGAGAFTLGARRL